MIIKCWADEIYSDFYFEATTTFPNFILSGLWILDTFHKLVIIPYDVSFCPGKGHDESVSDVYVHIIESSE